MMRLFISAVIFVFTTIGMAKTDVLEEAYPLSPTLYKLLVYGNQSNPSSTCVLNKKSIDFGLLFGSDHRELNRLELQIFSSGEMSSSNKKVKIFGSTITTENVVDVEFTSSSEIVLDLIKKWTEPPMTGVFLISEDQSCANQNNNLNLVTNLSVNVLGK